MAGASPSRCSSAISSRRARAWFCSECRQLSKYRTVELFLALSVQHLKPGHQIALREGDSSRGALMLRIERSANKRRVLKKNSVDVEAGDNHGFVLCKPSFCASDQQQFKGHHRSLHADTHAIVSPGRLLPRLPPPWGGDFKWLPERTGLCSPSQRARMPIPPPANVTLLAPRLSTRCVSSRQRVRLAIPRSGTVLLRMRRLADC